MPESYFRFTLAHEIAHTIFFQKTSPPTRAPGLPPGDAAEERLCDRIAAELLLPTEHFESEMRKIRWRNLTCGRLFSLANKFKVAPQVIGQQIANYHTDYGFAIWKMYAVPRKEVALRVWWAAMPEGKYLPLRASNHSPAAQLISRLFVKSCG